MLHNNVFIDCASTNNHIQPDQHKRAQSDFQRVGRGGRVVGKEEAGAFLLVLKEPGHLKIYFEIGVPLPTVLSNVFLIGTSTCYLDLRLSRVYRYPIRNALENTVC